LSIQRQDTRPIGRTEYACAGEGDELTDIRGGVVPELQPHIIAGTRRRIPDGDHLLPVPLALKLCVPKPVAVSSARDIHRRERAEHGLDIHVLALRSIVPTVLVAENLKLASR
jgi:hypothetical protein